MAVVPPSATSDSVTGDPNVAATGRTATGRRVPLLGGLRWPSAREIGVGRYFARTAMVVLAGVALGLCINLVVLSQFEHRAAQTRAFNRLRVELAEGVAPSGPVDANGRLLSEGTPVALLEIPVVGIHEVVLEGTSSDVLRLGAGHQRNTVLPGQPGVSVIDGRAAAYGGPFRGLGRLHKGDKLTVTTGIGTSTFLVLDLRRAHDLEPPPIAPNNGRLILVTATGAPFLPTGVLRVDADLVSPVQSASPAGLTSVSASEQPLGTDTSKLWELVLVLEAMIAVTVAAAWSWRRWGRTQTWIVFFPLAMLLGIYLTNQVARLLPNLL